MIEGRLYRHDTRIRHEAMGGLQPIHAGPARRHADGSALVATERGIHFSRRDDDCTTARRSAGRMTWPVRVSDREWFRGMASARKAKVLADSLPEDGTPGIENPLYDGGIDFRHVVLQNARSIHERQTCHANIVLHCDFLAGENARRSAINDRFPGPCVIRIVFCLGSRTGCARIFHLRLWFYHRVQPIVGKCDTAHQAGERPDVRLGEIHSVTFGNFQDLICGGCLNRHTSSPVQIARYSFLTSLREMAWREP